MIKNSFLIVALIAGSVVACKNKDSKDNSTNTSSTSVSSSTGTSTESSNANASDPSTTVAEKLADPKVADPKVAEVVKKIENPTLSPLQVLKEMGNGTATGGITAIKTGVCESNKIFMDSALANMARMEKILEMNLTGMMDEMFMQQRYNEVEFDYKDEKINGNTATVTAVHKESKKEQKINFTKENNVWKLCENINGKGNKEGVDPFKEMSKEVTKFENASAEEKAKMRSQVTFFINMMKLKRENDKKKAAKQNQPKESTNK